VQEARGGRTRDISSRERVILCGVHGLALRELLHPDILKDPVYLAVKKELIARW
jgi:hypothetical protein